MNIEQFVKKIIKEEVVWYLSKDEGSACCPSIQSESLLVYPFWHRKREAVECAIQEWSGYTAKKIRLTEFLEVWCIPLFENDILLGIGFDKKMQGTEVHPLILLDQLIQEIQLQKKEPRIKLKLYDDLDQIKDEIRQYLSWEYI